MSRKHVGASVGVVTLLLAFAGPALAKTPPPPIVVVHSVIPEGTPHMLIDSKGTEDVVWSTVRGHDQYGDRYFAVGYARKPKGAQHFTKVKLTHIFDPEDPLMYQVSPGVLEILVNGLASSAMGAAEGPFAWRSTNDGKSWKVINGSALGSVTQRDNGNYINEQNMFLAPGGPITTTGADGSGPVIQINNNLSTNYKTIATLSTPMEKLQMARSTSRATYMVGVGATESIAPFQVNNQTGQTTFPSCTDDTIETSLAAGRSKAVLAAIGCGHVWVRVISPDAKAGRLVKIGLTASNGDPWISAVAARNGHFTVAWANQVGDLSVARSSNGSHWKVSKGAVPIAGDGGTGAISAGVVTWYTFTSGSNRNQWATKVRAAPLSKTYRTPKPPSGHGIPDPRHRRLGSLAVVIPGKVALKHFRKTGIIKVKVIDALPTHVSVSVSDTRVKKSTTYDICDAARNAKVAPHHARTITLQCGSGVVVIGGSVGSGVDAHKGDLLSFGFSSRGSELSLTAHVA